MTKLVRGKVFRERVKLACVRYFSEAADASTICTLFLLWSWQKKHAWTFHLNWFNQKYQVWESLMFTKSRAVSWFVWYCDMTYVYLCFKVHHQICVSMSPCEAQMVPSHDFLIFNFSSHQTNSFHMVNINWSSWLISLLPFGILTILHIFRITQFWVAHFEFLAIYGSSIIWSGTKTVGQKPPRASILFVP